MRENTEAPPSWVVGTFGIYLCIVLYCILYSPPNQTNPFLLVLPVTSSKSTGKKSTETIWQCHPMHLHPSQCVCRWWHIMFGVPKTGLKEAQHSNKCLLVDRHFTLLHFTFHFTSHSTSLHFLCLITVPFLSLWVLTSRLVRLVLPWFVFLLQLRELMWSCYKKWFHPFWTL